MVLLPADFESTASTNSAMRPILCRILKKRILQVNRQKTPGQSLSGSRAPCFHLSQADNVSYSSTTSKSSGPAPHTGHTKSSGRLSPSYSYPHNTHLNFIIISLSRIVTDNLSCKEPKSKLKFKQCPYLSSPAEIDIDMSVHLFIACGGIRLEQQYRLKSV